MSRTLVTIRRITSILCNAFGSLEHEAWHDGTGTRIVRELCVRERVPDSYERAFVIQMRESIQCYVTL